MKNYWYTWILTFLRNLTFTEILKTHVIRVSLVAEWLRICLLMQGHGFEPGLGRSHMLRSN